MDLSLHVKREQTVQLVTVDTEGNHGIRQITEVYYAFIAALKIMNRTPTRKNEKSRMPHHVFSEFCE